MIRIVHVNGQVDEYSRPVAAKEVLEANPNHVISRLSLQGASSHQIVVVSPDAELKRGNIYFLIPASALSEKKKRKHQRRRSPKAVKMLDQDMQVTEAAGVEEKKSAREEEKKRGRHHRRKSSHVAEWRPNLESIYED